MRDDVGRPLFHGRYRGTVESVEDLDDTGRLLVRVPDVLGDDPCLWASPANPVAGHYAVPPKGTGVWVEFEAGDIERAVWSGAWRGSRDDVPAPVLAAPPGRKPIVVETPSHNRIVISDVPGEGLVLETGDGAKGPRIVLTRTEITLSTGGGASIRLSGKSVTVNGGALSVD
ncbi:phage baseplate assembly protein V [Actinomycetospora cinnamomea]|uniref:phage baseplate assembly protein V n=1 Tax=Actinomycetospora cinnamomea TaxID=663609 RepID=UPI001FAF095E|nr:phage baseplate assembly protein V [Actinomycetospora cinnamomea]